MRGLGYISALFFCFKFFSSYGIINHIRAVGGNMPPGKESAMQKKNRIVGTKTLMELDTGKEIEMKLVEDREYEKDSNFYKVFLKDFTAVLERVANRKTKILCFILKNMTRDNRFLYTYRKTAKETGCSYATVTKTMELLQNAGFLCRDHSGCYIVNPSVIFKGTLSRRRYAAKIYEEALEEGKSPAGGTQAGRTGD